MTSGSTWLLDNLFVPVAHAWLKKGCWRDAWRVVAGAESDFKEGTVLGELMSTIQRQERQERDRLYAWMDRRSEPQWKTAASTLKELEGRVADLPMPAATMGEENAAVLVWSLDELLLELEFTPASMSWYARERASTRGEGAEASSGALPVELLSWLERVARA